MDMQQPDASSHDLKDQELLDFFQRPTDVNPRADNDLLKKLKSGSWTFTSLAQKYLALVTSKMRAREAEPSGALCLSSIVRKKVIDTLVLTPDLESDLTTIVSSLSAPLLRDLLRDCRMPYYLLRAILNHQSEATSKLVDIDEAVLHNERYLRLLQDEETRHLITIGQLAKILWLSTRHNGYASIQDIPDLMSFKRKDPPLGGLELLNANRTSYQELLTNNNSFRKAFDATIIGRILRQLDWTNVLLAGFEILRIVIALDETANPIPLYAEHFIPHSAELHIYGMNAEDANQKLRHIWDIWSTGVVLEGLSLEGIWNTVEACTFRANDFDLRIRLKLCRSPLEILISSHLGIGAIGFDGTKVLMLPSCARALETGYTNFTMNTVGEWVDLRLPPPPLASYFNYAQIGFGLRILPSYAHALDLRYDHSRGRAKVLKSNWEPDEGHCSGHRPPGTKLEPGLKYMKRILFAADNSQANEFPDYTWAIGSLMLWHRIPASLEESIRLTEQSLTSPDSDLGEDISELVDFMPSIDKSTVENGNNRIFTDVLQPAISRKLGLPLIRNGYRGYLTRRVRTHIYTDDLPTMMRTQLTIPVLIPHDLELSINNALKSAGSGLPAHFLSSPMLIPLCDTSAHDPAAQNAPSIPPLRDTGSEEGNLRYFVITNKSMWSGQSVLTDGIFTVARVLFESLGYGTGHGMDCRQYEMIKRLANSLQGTLRPPSPCLRDTQLSNHGLDPAEVASFRSWAFEWNGEELDDDYNDVCPDKEFWEDGDEGEWDGLNVPAWREADEEEEVEIQDSNEGEWEDEE